jgi:uncharacterized protein
VQEVAGSNPVVPKKYRFAVFFRPFGGEMEKKLLEILACPVCKSRLIFDPKRQELICHIDKLAYPIREDVPIMLVDEARRLTDRENV